VLRAASLLKVTRTSRRPGRPISYYRSSQDAYRVALAATGFLDHRDQATRIGAPIYQRITDAYSTALARSGTTTRFITRDDHGSIYSTDQPPHRTARRRPLLFEDRILQLTAEQAESLCAQLDRALNELTGPWNPVMCDQIATVDLNRLAEPAGFLTLEEMQRVDDALSLVLDL